MIEQKLLYPKYFLSYRELFPVPDIFHLPMDENGIAMWDYKGRMGHHKEYPPWVISFYALGMYNLYHDTLKEAYLKNFFKHADFIVKGFIRRENYGIWPVKLAWISPGYLCIPPFVSGMYQGLGISVMVRAWVLTEDGIYLDIAKDALLSFKVPVSNGGVLRIDKKGFWWYDEYACVRSANVLNGFLFALIGIYEYYDITKDPNALFLFNQGIKKVKHCLDKYDLNLLVFKWSRYDDKHLIYSGPKYHNWHIKQLRKLYEITKEKKYLAWATKWFKYQQKYSFFVNSKFFRGLWSYGYMLLLDKLYRCIYKIPKEPKLKSGLTLA